jgi:parvulin-like peptidyl-prolyl isomerase
VVHTEKKPQKHKSLPANAVKGHKERNKREEKKKKDLCTQQDLIMSKHITITNQDILHHTKLDCLIPDFINKIIAQKVIENTASEMGIKVEMEELQAAADKFRLTNELETADETWEWLKTNFISLDDFEELVYLNLLTHKLAQNLFADKVEPYFFKNQLDYASAVIYEVTLDDKDLAMELFYSLSEGEISFYEIAHQYTQDIDLRRSGGYRGILHRSNLKPEISAAVFAAKAPKLLKPIVTSKGVNLIFVEEVIQPNLDDNLRSKIMFDLFYEWLNTEITKAEVIKQLDFH